MTSEGIDDIIERHKNDYQFGDDALHGAIAGAVQDAHPLDAKTRLLVSGFTAVARLWTREAR